MIKKLWALFLSFLLLEVFMISVSSIICEFDLVSAWGWWISANEFIAKGLIVFGMGTFTGLWVMWLLNWSGFINVEEW